MSSRVQLFNIFSVTVVVLELYSWLWLWWC